jgi:diguanylate cyclase (GGDEF)-like protein/PAS domain S-box-containing protein
LSWALAVLKLYSTRSEASPLEVGLFVFLCIIGAVGISLSVRHFYGVRLEEKPGARTFDFDETIRNAILETSPDSFSIISVTGRILFCNRESANMLGYNNPDELSGRNALSVFRKMEYARAVNLLEQILRGERIRDAGFVIHRKDNSHFHAEVSASLIKNKQGSPIAILASLRDVTERKWVEAQIRESETLYRIVADNTYEWEFWQAPSGRYLYISPSCKRISGHDDVEFISNASLFMDIIHPQDLERYKTHQKRVIEEKAAGEIEFRILHADGHELWINYICHPVFDKSGVYLGIRGSNRDITIRKQAEMELLLANEKLRSHLTEIEDLHVILREQALHDPLTGLYNRRYMEDALRKEHGRAAREGYPIGVALLDMDELKTINDTYGHALGDKALIILSEKLRELTRFEDIICRYGGDEFLVILYNTSLENAFKRVEEWRRVVEETPLPFNDQTLQITFTAGVAAYPMHGKDLEEVLHVADDALYHAKNSGRNFVKAADHSP